ncbi:UNVERIFIED_ORG: flavin reductase (DIM6/NTAB) family NADH-FMN oxidoreductase RutF [Gordonia westfalica J30]
MTELVTPAGEQGVATLPPLTEPLDSDDPTQKQKTLRRAMSRFPSGVTALCCLGEDGPIGMAASSFTSVSLEPPLVSVCIGRGSRTWARLAAADRIGISVLGGDQASLCADLAARDVDRFASADWDSSPDGAVFLRGAALWLDCRVNDVLGAGDHVIVLLEVLGTRVADEQRAPLVFHRSTLTSLGGHIDG